MYTLDSFFAGVGGIDLGFEQTHHFKTVWANEFDKYACQTYHLNFPKVNLNPNDIQKVKTQDIPSADVMIGGFPCQPFSLAGYRRGFKDPRGLMFFQILRAIKAKRPQAFLLENVKNLVGHHNGRTFKVIREALTANHYYIKWQVMNTKEYSKLPQNRERIYIVGFKNKSAYKNFHFPKPIQKTLSIHNIFDFNNPVNKRFYYTKNSYIYPRLAKAIHSTRTVYEYRRGYVRANKNNICPAITSICGEGGDNTPIIYTNSHKIRSLTPRECFRIQGFPDTYKLPNQAKGHLLMQAGNAVSVPVIKRIAEKIYLALKKQSHSKEHMKPTYKYIGLYLNIIGKNRGQSYTILSSNNKNKVKIALEKLNLPILTNQEYFKAIKHHKEQKFGMVEEI